MAGDHLDIIIKCRGLLGCKPNIHLGRISRLDGDTVSWRFKTRDGSPPQGTVEIYFAKLPPLDDDGGRPIPQTITLDKNNNWTSKTFHVRGIVIFPGPFSYKVTCSMCSGLELHPDIGDEPQVIIDP